MAKPPKKIGPGYIAGAYCVPRLHKSNFRLCDNYHVLGCFMGLLSKLFFRKRKATIAVRYEGMISCELSRRTVSEEELRLESLGYKRDNDGQLVPPDTVFINKGSDVYHADSACRGIGVYGGPSPLSEDKAIELGYRRCKICRWDNFGKPPAPEDVPLVQPAHHSTNRKNKEASSLIKRGYPVFQGFVYPPDTVFVCLNSRVYHSVPYSKSCPLNNYKVLPVPESEAVRRGLRRCKKCQWPAPPPAPSPFPVEFSKPICHVYD